MLNFKPYTLNLPDGLLSIERPLVMGILNVTPDSFYADSRCYDEAKLEQRVLQMVDEGVDIIDIGAYSTRPGAAEVSEQEEVERLQKGFGMIRRICPHMITSVDTFRGNVARRCVEEWGCSIINDVSGGTLDESMFNTAARLKVPYILMHMRGTPATMQQLTHYDNGVVTDVINDLKAKINRLKDLGVNQLIIDPGFGFSKTLEQNYELFCHLEEFHELDAPLFVGISRKSMIYKTFNCTPMEALNGTTVLNTIALMKGAHILRVHDVEAAIQARTLVQKAHFNG